MSPGSSEDRLREAYADVSEAVEDGLLTDATSRNSLYKIHVSLGKIVNTLDERQPARRASRSVSIAGDGPSVEEKTVVEDGKIEEQSEKEEEEEEEDDGTVVVPKKEPDSSLIDEILSDDDDDTAMQNASATS